MRDLLAPVYLHPVQNNAWALLPTRRLRPAWLGVAPHLLEHLPKARASQKEQFYCVEPLDALRLLCLASVAAAGEGAIGVTAGAGP
jgi:hypothetical protein